MSNLSIKEIKKGTMQITMSIEDYEALIAGFQEGASVVERQSEKVRGLPSRERKVYERVLDLRKRIISYARSRFFSSN